MIRTAVAVLFTVLAGAGAWAEAQDEQAGERARIAVERQRVETIHREDQKACYARFGVNDCLGAARARRNAVLTDLRRQELDLNDIQRRRRSSQRQAELEERAASAVKPPEAASRTPAAQQQREARSAAREAEREAAVPAAAAPEPAPRARQAPRSDPEGVRRHAARAAEIEARKQRIEKKVAERKKPAASGLPLPP